MSLTQKDKLEQIRNQSQIILNQIKELSSFKIKEFENITETKCKIFHDIKERLKEIIKYTDEIKIQQNEKK